MRIRREHLVLGAAGLALFGAGWWLLSPSALPLAPGPGIDPLVVPPASGGVRLTRKLSDQFFVDVDRMARDFQTKGSRVGAEDFLAVFLAESDCRPDIANGIGCAGLNQICPTLKADPTSGLKAVGFSGSVKDYISLSAEEQLKYVRRWFEQRNAYAAMRDYGQLYLLNFLPGFVGKPDDFVLASASNDPHGWYRLNKAVDAGNKGYIEVADMGRFVRRRIAANQALWAELRMRLERVRRPAVAGIPDVIGAFNRAYDAYYQNPWRRRG